MLIAVTAEGNTTSARVSKVFARCQYFLLYTPASKQIEFVENPYQRLTENAGLEAANFLVNRGVMKIISGEFGNRIREITDPRQIQLVVIAPEDKTVQDILSLIEK